MKTFLREHSYDAVKMFLNQFATAIFGVVLALAAGMAENDVLRNVTSVFAILFYLFLIYTMTWEIGFRDKIPIEKGRKKFQPFTGLWISLLANSINFLLAFFITLGILTSISVFEKVGSVSAAAALFIEGMFTGVLANHIAPETPLNSQWWIYFLLPLPAMLTSTIAYILGVKDKQFTGFFKYRYPKSDRDPKEK